MDRDKRIRQIIMDLADAAYTAADGVGDVVQNASHVVGEKYDLLKLNVEISRLQSEQDKIFSGIGHTMYMIQTGEIKPDGADTSETMDAQQTIDRLLLLADQKQQEIDAARQKLQAINGVNTCASCGKATHEEDAFCPGCGAKL